MSGDKVVADEIIARLGGGDDVREWVAGLEAVGPPAQAIVLPEGADLVDALVRLSVAHEDIDTLVRLRPAPEHDPVAWWIIERTVAVVLARMGRVEPWVRIPALPEAFGPLRRWLFVYVFVAALPHVRAFHRERGIPDDVSWATLADLGRQMAVHRKRDGESGFDDPVWITLHFSGAIYALSRLQYERITLGNSAGQAILDSGVGDGPGTPALSVHIPGYYGPFDPASCDASLDRAREFFPRHFPEERYDLAVCYSWLLDPQLAEYLPANSNIIRFQRRFTIIPDKGSADNALTLRFVFGMPTDLPLDTYPQRTTLERAIITHLKAGQEWRGGVGWLRL
ncbi:MAG TPA: acyltransferase domain-containing protein [Thermomicrobiales bacterium]|jgi:hypothetical protein|nr:acyltransferase domain-containing protein [Thermomicrobiales bacterium]